MLHYKHILITTDLSSDTQKIIDHVKALSAHSKSKISVLHVIEHTPIVYGGGEFSIPLDVNLEEIMKENARKALAHLGKKMHIDEKDQYIETGSVKIAVIKLAEKTHADLIIVGAHARHGIERILGSTANAILHAAKCDVLAVRTYE